MGIKMINLINMMESLPYERNIASAAITERGGCRLHS